jgi:hypothetical protein
MKRGRVHQKKDEGFEKKQKNSETSSALQNRLYNPNLSEIYAEDSFVIAEYKEIKRP